MVPLAAALLRSSHPAENGQVRQVVKRQVERSLSRSTGEGGARPSVEREVSVNFEWRITPVGA